MSSWIKAGLIGSLVLIVLNLVGMVGCLFLITCILGLLVYAGIGALAAYWIPPVRDAGTGAGQGALAAGLAALIAGAVNTIFSTVQMQLADPATTLSLMPAESLQAIEELGWDPTWFTGAAAGAVSGSMCCIAGLLLAAVLGAMGGAILAGVKPD
jgi:hypothetical protein